MLLNERAQVETNVAAPWGVGSWRLWRLAVALPAAMMLHPGPLAIADDHAARQIGSADGQATDSAARRGEPVEADALVEQPLLPRDELALADTKYQNAEEAWRVGVAFYNSRNFAASREPFEAALRMAPDDQFKLKVYDALKQAYRMLPDIDKMVEACEFVITHSDSDAKRSITRRELLGFVYQRGKIDALVQRYEQRLKKDPNDRTSLFLLSEIFAVVKRDPQRSAQLVERLAELEKKSGKPLDVQTSAQLASQYVKAKKFKEGAELYEQIAPLDDNLAAWHWKEAATAWLKANDKEKALAAAKRAAEIGPDKRSQLLTHFWHRHVADVFLATGEPNLAIPHYEKAIENTNIDGYIQGCQASLAEARKQAGG